MKVVTTEQMRSLEVRAVEAGIPEDTLMENAGLAVARNVAQRMGAVRGKRTFVLVGPGNNGADGMVAARYLADWGAVVTLYMTSARRNEVKFEECRERRVRIVEASEDLECWQLASYVSLADLVLDAVLGIGARYGLDPPLREIFESIGQMKAQRQRPIFVALDLPTGLDADSGNCDMNSFPADVTLTLGAPKVGLLQFPGAARVGTLETLSIGLPDGTTDGITLDLVDTAMVSGFLPSRPIDGHKGSFGDLLVIGGSRRFVGAPVLAASAAYRAGAGLVALAAPESVSRIAAGQLLEQVHLPLPESEDGAIAGEAATAARSALSGASAAVVGPGLGNTSATGAFLRALLLSQPATHTPTVIDADALNILAETYGWESMLAVPAVLTPHPGEMSSAGTHRHYPTQQAGHRRDGRPALEAGRRAEGRTHGHRIAGWPDSAQPVREPCAFDGRHRRRALRHHRRAAGTGTGALRSQRHASTSTARRANAGDPSTATAGCSRATCSRSSPASPNKYAPDRHGRAKESPLAQQRLYLLAENGEFSFDETPNQVVPEACGPEQHGSR